MRNVVKSFPGVRAVDDVSLDVRPGEVHALIGENGAGKSTLMHLVACVYQPDSGAIELDGVSVVGLNEQGAYGPSKGAVIQITRQMAIDYAVDNIRVNAVCPGTVDTPLLQKAAVDSGDVNTFLDGLKSAHPIGRISTPREMAAFYRFLSSDEATFFTGAILMIDGGFTAR